MWILTAQKPRCPCRLKCFAKPKDPLGFIRQLKGYKSTVEKQLIIDDVICYFAFQNQGKLKSQVG